MKRRSFEDYSYLNKFILNVCGVLPMKLQNDSANVFFVFLTLASLSFLGGPSFYGLYFNWENIDPSERFSIAVTSQVFIIGIIKVLILFPKRKKHYELLKSCERLWSHVECERDLAVVEEYAHQKLQVMYIYLSSAFGTSLCFLISPLFTSFVVAANGTVLISKSLPWSAGIFHDNVMKFYIWYGLQVPATLSVLTSITSINIAPFFYAMHAGIHMRLCQKKFESVNEQIVFEKTLTKNDSTWNAMKNKFFQHVVSGVVYHSETLQYCQGIEEIFQSVIFTEIFSSFVAISGYCFLSQVVPKENLPKVAVSMLALIMGIFLLCWPPDSLQDESFKVSHAAYNLRWYEWTRKEGKLVYIIIEKSQKPVVITANKMVVLSLETFAWFLKSAFSMFTLLQRVME